jgi:hypothetical protein
MAELHLRRQRQPWVGQVVHDIETGDQVIGPRDALRHFAELVVYTILDPSCPGTACALDYVATADVTGAGARICR